jgi:phosphomannomutase/phosphoglucomutase
MGVFHRYDVRGVYPSELNENLAEKIGRAFGIFLQKKNQGRVVVGYDARLSSPAIKNSVIIGLTECGIDVIDIGMAATPVVYFCCYKLGLGWGIAVTGSHLTKEYNGMKFCNEAGIPISHEMGLGKIEELALSENFRPTTAKGSVSKKNVEVDYANFMKSFAKKKFSGIKIVVDGANGAAGKLYAKILRECGADVVELYCEPDGNFPNHTPNPMKKEFIVDLEKKVREVGADLGVAFDGDGDRIAVVDENGAVCNSNHIFAMMIEDALKNAGDAENKKIVHDVLCSKLIDDVTIKNGGVPIAWNVGHTLIAAKCFEENAMMAGEVSGHYFFREANYTDDVMMACLKILGVLKNSGGQLSELTKKYPKFYEFQSRIPVRPDAKFQFIENLKKELAKQYEIMTMEGVRVNFENGWMLFRASNTEPVISMGYESSSKEEFEKIKSIADEIIKKIPR